MNIAGATINVVQIVGMGIAIIMLIAMAIKWISASPTGKAELAKSIRIYVLGVIIIFAAVGLLQLVKVFAGGLNSDVGKRFKFYH